MFCENASGVCVAVLTARSCEISFSVRGGGHDWAGRSIRGEVVADLTRMGEVFIEGLVTTLGGNALSINVAEASSARGLTAIKGIIVSVGKAVSVGRLLRSLDCKVWFGTRQHPGFGSYTCGRANRLNRCETRAGPIFGLSAVAEETLGL